MINQFILIAKRSPGVSSVAYHPIKVGGYALYTERDAENERGLNHRIRTDSPYKHDYANPVFIVRELSKPIPAPMTVNRQPYIRSVIFRHSRPINGGQPEVIGIGLNTESGFYTVFPPPSAFAMSEDFCNVWIDHALREASDDLESLAAAIRAEQGLLLVGRLDR